MLVTRKGTLLVYCEARRASDDWALMDILMQRSEDRAKSFSPPCILARGTEAHPTVNNPVMVQDGSGRIHLLYCEDYAVGGGRALRRYSDDDGITWSEPVDVTAYTRPDFRNAWAFGPGHGIVTGDGTLVIPVWMVPKPYGAPLHAHGPSVVSTFYSRDNGETWAVGDILEATSEIVSPSETAAALTSDGRVYLNMRFVGNCRAKAYSQNGYTHWSQYAPDKSLPDPGCFGSVVAYHDGVHPYTLIFANCASATERDRVTLRISTDNGRTFPVSRLLDGERGGYVEVAADPHAGLIYALYEDNWGQTDHLAVLNYEWLLRENG